MGVGLGSRNAPRWSWEGVRSAFDWRLVWRQRMRGAGCLETKSPRMGFPGVGFGGAGGMGGIGSGGRERRRIRHPPPARSPLGGVSGLLLRIPVLAGSIHFVPHNPSIEPLCHSFCVTFGVATLERVERPTAFSVNNSPIDFHGFPFDLAILAP